MNARALAVSLSPPGASRPWGSRATAARTADWPGWRGPNRDAVSQEKGLLQQWGPEGPPLAWKAGGPRRRGSRAWRSAGDRIFTMGDKDGAQHVFALKRERRRAALEARGGPDLRGPRAGSRSTPVVDGERVFALGSDGDLVCLDAASGKLVWRRTWSATTAGR